ncbi:MAG: hypothetical protein H8E98_08030 [Bacteroidetes bacterium]|nr:hypothetical protein [Bacteroidota bacterium]MBL6963697.1 hypothetical protein [Bacteroidota bacterium]
MESVILHTNKSKDLSLILQLAKKLGISARKLSKSELEEFGLSLAITEGKTGEYVDTEIFLNELRDESKD